MFYKKTNKDSNKNEQPEAFKSSDNLKNPEILGVNLVKDELLVFFDWNKHILSALLIFIVAGVFIFEVYLGLDYWEKSETKKASLIEVEVNQLKKDTAALNSSSQDALSYKEKSLAFSDLLNNHVYWTRFFSWLESNTLNTIKFNGFQGDVKGEYTLSASSPTYAEVSWQTKIFSDSSFVNSVSVDEVFAEIKKFEDESTVIKTEEFSEVSFEMELDIKPDIFKK